MDKVFWEELAEVKQGVSGGVSEEASLAVLSSTSADMPGIMSVTSALRGRYFGERVSLCSILNAKSGACHEDCGFCAQSLKHQTDASVFGLRSVSEMVSAYDKTVDLPVGHFGLVTSGGGLSSRELEQVCEVINQHQREGTHWCGSLGCLSEEQLKYLQASGLKRFHHNLETAESFFPRICTTHTYAQRLNTVRLAKKTGLEVCCGGILGLGESLEQRVEFAFTLKRERVDAIPLNFLVPVKGTAMEDHDPMKPWDILRSIAMFRLVNPETEIKVCAGRLLLRDLQALIFQAGANGMMIGDLLTVAGRGVEEDMQMLHDLEMDYEAR